MQRKFYMVNISPECQDNVLTIKENLRKKGYEMTRPQVIALVVKKFLEGEPLGK